MGKQQGEGKLPSLEELGLSNNSKMPSLDDLGLGKPQGVSSKGLKNTSTIFTKPSQPSQASSNLFGGKPQNEFIGKENATRIDREVMSKGSNVLNNFDTKSIKKLQEQFERDVISNQDDFTQNIRDNEIKKDKLNREIKAKEDDEFWRNADEASTGARLKNSAKNILTGLKQVIPQLNVASADIWEGVLGKELASDWYKLEGRDIGKVRLDAYKTMEELQKQMLPTTTGITENIKHLNASGLIVNLADAVGSLVTTGVPALVTGGGATIPTMIGQSIIDYNNTKAKSKGLSIEQLYSSGQAELKTPLLIGALAGGLELVGLKSVKNVVSAGAILKGAGAKKIALYALEVNKEGITNLLQGGLDAVNIVKASGGSDGDASEAFFERVASKKGLDEYLMGVFASAGAGGMSHIVSSIKDIAVRKNVETKIAEITQLDQDINNENINQTTKTIIADQVKKKISDISTEIDDLDNKTDNLSDQDKVKSEELNNKKQELEKVISEPNLSDAGKKVATEQLVAIDTELSSIKPTTEKKQEYYQLYEDAVKDSNTVEEAFNKSIELSEAKKLGDTFVKKYNPTGELSDKEMFKKFYDKIRASEAATTKEQAIATTSSVGATEPLKPIEKEDNKVYEVKTEYKGEIQQAAIDDYNRFAGKNRKDFYDGETNEAIERDGVEVKVFGTIDSRGQVFQKDLSNVEISKAEIDERGEMRGVVSYNNDKTFIRERQNADGSRTINIAEGISDFAGRGGVIDIDFRLPKDSNVKAEEIAKIMKDALSNRKSGDKTTIQNGIDQVKQLINERNTLPTNNTQSQVQGEIQPVKDEVVPIKVEDAKTTPIPKVEEVVNQEAKSKEKPIVDPLATETTQGTEKSNLDLEFIADKDIPKETVDAYNKKGKLAGTTEVPNEKIVNKQNEMKTDLETLNKLIECLTK